MITLDALNATDRTVFVAAVGDIFEHGDWVAERAHAARPFATVAKGRAACARSATQSPCSKMSPTAATKTVRSVAFKASSVIMAGSSLRGSDRAAGETSLRCR